MSIINKTQSAYKKFNHYWYRGVAILWVFVVLMVFANKDTFFNNNDTQTLNEPEIEAINEINFQNCPTSASNTPVDISPLKTNIDIGTIDLIEDTSSVGVEKNEIPSISKPKFISSSVAIGCIEENEKIFIVEYNNETKAYPYSILAQHQIVNDTIGDVHIAITYSPLTDSFIAYKSEDMILGNSGRLYKNNILLFDKETESLWLQITGESVIGDKTNEKLESIPHYETIFKFLKENLPNSKILSFETGYKLDYSKDPYEIYHAENNQNIKVIGIVSDNNSKAYLIDTILEQNIIDTIGNTDVLIENDVIDNILSISKYSETKNEETQYLPHIETYRTTWETFFPDSEIYQ